MKCNHGGKEGYRKQINSPNSVICTRGMDVGRSRAIMIIYTWFKRATAQVNILCQDGMWKINEDLNERFGITVVIAEGVIVEWLNGSNMIQYTEIVQT